MLDIIEQTAIEMNLTQLLNETNAQEQEKMEATIRKTTTEVVYDSKPTTLVIVQQIPQKVFVGAYMRFPIQVVMLDETGDSMTEVGYMGDPMRIRASSPGADISNDETYFTPGNGLANFGKMTFNNPGRFSLLIELSYAGEANVTVAAVQTISFEVGLENLNLYLRL